VFAHVHIPSLGGATELRGHVVLMDLWTLTCINWLRTEPYIAPGRRPTETTGWSSSASTRPEFSSKHQIGRVRQAIRLEGSTTRRGRQRLRNLERLRQPRLPALSFVDTDGVIRDHHVGEGRYEQSERAIQQPLGVERELVCVEGLGVLIGVLGFPP
jgi:hypothetical protein